MDKVNLSTDALEDIARMMARLLGNKINPNSIYVNEQFTSFSQHSYLLEDTIGFSYYHNENTFHGNVNNGGHFSGTVNNNRISISCSQSGNSAAINF